MLAFNGVNQIKGRLKSFQTAFNLVNAIKRKRPL